jgi:hypothetical protein
MKRLTQVPHFESNKVPRMNTMMNKPMQAPAQAQANADADADKDGPKRARSAYNYFFRAGRATLLGISEEELEAQQNQRRKHRKTPGMIGFAKLASTVGSKWKLLNEEEKLPYALKCQADRERYSRDLEVWRKKHGICNPDAMLSNASAQERTQSCPASVRRRQDAELLVMEMKRNAVFSSTPAVATASMTPQYAPSSVDVAQANFAAQTRKKLLAEAFEPISIQDMKRVNSVEKDRELHELAGLDEWNRLFQKLVN